MSCVVLRWDQSTSHFTYYWLGQPVQCGIYEEVVVMCVLQHKTYKEQKVLVPSIISYDISYCL